MSTILRVAAIQPGPGQPDTEANVDALLRLVDQAADDGAELVVLPELSTVRYFCQHLDAAFFDLAEPIPGPTVERFAARARERRCAVLLGLFERGAVEGHYYNSAVLIGADGNVVPGHLPDGRLIPAYRKTHLSNAVVDGVMSHEKYYFRPGPGLPVFQLGHVRLGVLICYDRSFPEAWRELALQGADLILVASATPGWRERMFQAELMVHAYEQCVWAIATNKAGDERMGERVRHYFGRSCIVAPTGEIVAEGPAHEGPAVVCAPIDLGEVQRARRFFQAYRDRRPEIYPHVGAP